MSDPKEVTDEVDGASVYRIVHTPGPWMILDLREKGEDCITIAMATSPQALCRIRNEVSGVPLNQEDLANAKLIAASPDMFGIVHRLATCDWMGEAELSMWIKKCREIVKRIESALRSDGRQRKESMKKTDDTPKPVEAEMADLLEGGQCDVPSRVAICPECGGKLYIDNDEWSPATGLPTQSGFTVSCEAEEEALDTWMHDDADERDMREIAHRHWQSDWQPIRDAVWDWLKSATAD